MEIWIIGFSTAIYVVVMFFIYWRFNRDGASLVQMLAYWGIICTFLATQRIGMMIDRTDTLKGAAIRALVLFPIYFYIVASKGKE